MSRRAFVQNGTPPEWKVVGEKHQQNDPARILEELDLEGRASLPPALISSAAVRMLESATRARVLQVVKVKGLPDEVKEGIAAQLGLRVKQLREETVFRIREGGGSFFFKPDGESLNLRSGRNEQPAADVVEEW